MAARSQPLAAFKDWQSKPGDLHLETFKEKGRGSYGVVRVGKWQERSVAVKTLHDILLEAAGPQGEAVVKTFKEECLKLRRLDHRRVVKLIATFRDERGRPLLVMEALEESLEDYLLRNAGKLPVLRQISIVNELADGLAYLHENNIVHRDLKPANVLMGDDDHIRIADLGQAKLLANIEQLMTTTQPGTISYLPPETLRGGGLSSYTFSIDCFSLGVVALCVATQSLPTCGVTGIGTVEEAVRRKKDLDKLAKEHPLKTIILGCLQNTPSLRPQSFFIKEHTQALMEIEGYKSRLQEQDKTVIQQEQKLQTQKEQIEYLQKERAAVLYGRQEMFEVRCFHNAQVLADSGARKRVVAFGVTGHGRSSFLNFLLKAEEDVFLTSGCIGFMGAVNSVPKKTQACSAMIGGEQWLLIDTPGFFDTDHLQEGIGNPLEAQVEQQKQEFYRNIMRAYLEAGPEISAFLLVYNGSFRWGFEMSQQIKFLNSVRFPWSHCILVITHADAAFRGIPDEKRRYKEFFKAARNPQSKLPGQLKQLILDTSYRVILVESQKKDDGYHESVVTRMKDYIAGIAGKHGKYRNELFCSIGKK